MKEFNQLKKFNKYKLNLINTKKKFNKYKFIP